MAQIKDGFLDPNIELKDLEGNNYNLYALLDEGKTVILDFSATWCEPCWVFHNSGILKQLQQQYSNEVQVFMIEADPVSSLDCLMDACDDIQTGNVTLGNWIEGIPYPIINDDNLGALFQISFFPTLYAICPDRTVTLLNPDESPKLQEIVDVVTTCGIATDDENILKTQVYTGQTNYLCSPVQPSFIVQNYGTNAITKATFLLSINGDTVETYNWAGNLENTYDFEKITFKAFEIADFNNIELTIKEVNGSENTDSINYTYIQAVNKAFATLNESIKITIITDDYGDETYWAIKNNAEEIVIEGGNEKVGLYNFGTGYPLEHESAYASNETIVKSFMLPNDGCYQVFITDAFGDGFCCAAGNGSFKITDSSGNNLVNITTELQDIFEAALRLERQPPRANFFIEQNGNAVKVIDASALAQEWSWVFGDDTDTVTVQNPSRHIYEENGIYNICLTVKNEYDNIDGVTKCHLVEITEAPVAIEEIELANNIQVAPNPASNQIKIKLNHPFSNLVRQIELYNVDGKLMKKINPGRSTSSISLELNELSNGIYIVTVKLENTTTSKRLIITK